MNDILGRYQSRIEAELDASLRLTDVPGDLLTAMQYAVESGGKRIRPTLMYMSASALGEGPELVDKTACAVEFVHTYSLVHDDLPAMDDDDLRRGKPTCHVKFGEALAILAGDALQARAFELITNDEKLTADKRLELCRLLSDAIGASGMVGGQAIDLAYERKEIDAKTLEDMHRRKTGALISASVVAGAIIAGAADTERAALERYGYNLGLAFQVKDDILDEIGDASVTGKSTGSDQKRCKSTFVSLYGVERANSMLAQLRDDALAALEPFGELASPLSQMAEFVATRDH